MNYKRLYENLIQKRQNTPADGYTELHHIIPRSLGGTDDPETLIALTAREHFIAHYLLSKMYPEDSFEWHKMNHAFMMMKSNSGNQDRYFNSRLYESARKNFRKVMSKAQSGTRHSQYGTQWIQNIDLKESKKIRKGEPIPDGWQLGRYYEKVAKLKLCKKCGQEMCERPDVCNSHQRLCRMVSTFGFDKTAYGSKRIYEEYDRVTKMLHEEYHVHGNSIQQMANKYGVLNETLRCFLRALGIDRRSLSESVKISSRKH